MAPLPQNNTNRLWVDYNDGRNDHVLLCRYVISTGFGTPEAMGAVDAFLTAINDSLYLITILGARVAAQGSNISAPVAWTGGATYGGGAMPAVFAPRQVMWLGRTGGGRRFRLSIWGVNTTTPDNFRIADDGSNFVADGIDVLETQQPLGAFRAIDGNVPLLYPYADIQFNSYWETQARG